MAITRDFAMRQTTHFSKRTRVVASKPDSLGCAFCRYASKPLPEGGQSNSASLKKVKCDGTRPQCMKCVKAGRKCPGYYTWEIAPPLCRDRDIDDRERHAFGLFRIKTLPALWKSTATGGGWIQYAMVLSDTERPVFQAMAAVAYAHKSMLEVVHTSLARPVEPAATEMALLHYCKAITLLREYINGAIDGICTLEPILLTSMLLMIFENYQGRHLNGVRHIRFARKLVDEGCPPDISCSDGTATAILAIKIASTGPPVTGIRPAGSEVQSPSKGLRTEVPPLELVSASLDSLIAATSRICTDLRHIAGQTIRATSNDATPDLARLTCLGFCRSRTVELSRHSKLDDSIGETLYALSHWNTMVTQHLAAQQLELSQALILLKIRHSTAFYTLATCRQTEECYSDCFEKDLINTLRLVETYLQQREDVVYLGPQRPWFDKSFHRAPIFEHGILSALITISTKCRTSWVRWRALDVLVQSRRIESEHSSALLSEFAKRVIALEEDGARDLVADASKDGGFNADEVPEQARFSDVVIAPVEGKSEMFRLVCARFAHEKGGSIEIVEYQCFHKNNNTILLV